MLFAATNGARLGYRPALDGIRGVAVSLVLAAHLVPNLLISAGAAGVIMFFTLSGFLITTLLIEEREASGRIDLPAFYRRRALRLLPALIAVLALLLVLDTLVGSQAGYRRPAFFALFYAANWAIISGIDFHHINHTWSLAIEEHFYLLWPLTTVLVLGHYSKRALLSIALVGMACSVALRIVLWQSGASLPRVLYGTDTRLDGLLIGCVLAIAGARAIRRLPMPAVPIAVAAIASIILIRDDAYHFAAGYAAVASGTAVVIVACLAGQRTASVLSIQPLVSVGRISYGLYLWHLPVYGAVFKYGASLPRLLQSVIAVVLAFSVAAVSYLIIERPFLRLKRRSRAPTRIQTGSRASDELRAAN
jgi:peptidoglycan/LPS O-acetylase OafA/YrhL